MFVSFCFPMKTLQREREIIVYLPDDYYQQNKDYPVLYIQDGQNAFLDRKSTRLNSSHVSESRMPSSA